MPLKTCFLHSGRVTGTANAIFDEIAAEHPGEDPLDFLDFSQTFCSFAWKEGGSERLHFDGDPKGLLAVVIIFRDPNDPGDGGDVCMPNIGWRIPMGHCDALLMPASSLLHCTAPWSGKRYAFTGFIDLHLAKKAGWNLPEDVHEALTDEEFIEWALMEWRERKVAFEEKTRKRKAEEELQRIEAENWGRTMVVEDGSWVYKSIRLQSVSKKSYREE